MDRSKDNLKALGRETEYLNHYAPEVLETFENKHLALYYSSDFTTIMTPIMAMTAPIIIVGFTGS